MVEYSLKDRILRIDCRNWVIEPSIEDSSATFGLIIGILMKEKDVEKIVLEDEVESEYTFEQIEMLEEIAEVYKKLVEEERIMHYKDLDGKCKDFLNRKREELSFLVLEGIKKDPIATYFKILNQIKIFENLGECQKLYSEKILKKIAKELEKTKIIKITKEKFRDYGLGRREIYRKIFHRFIKPRFMLTSLKLVQPEGKIVDRYYLRDGSQVEIYKVKGKVRYYYYVYPKELKIGPTYSYLINEAKSKLLASPPKEISDIEKSRQIFFEVGRDLIRETAASKNIYLEPKILNELSNLLVRHTSGFGCLEILLSDEKIQDVYVNSPIGSLPIFIYHSDFEECETNLYPSKEDAETWATRFRLFSGRPLDEANPILDTELIVPGGRARVAAITRTLSPEGLAFAFRRHRERPWTFPLFIKNRMINPLFAGLLSFIIDGGRSILIAGSRGSGKTSLLSALITEIMRKYRIIVQEDTLELPVTQLRKIGFNIERLKSRSIITKVEIEVSPEEALRTALRLGDSVLIVGEVRSLEALTLFEAMRIGALANLVAGTIHGETAYGVFDRVVHDLKVPTTSFKAIDLICIANLLKSPDGLHRFRRVIELTEVRKHWKEDPLEENGFMNLMEYSAKIDSLKPTEILLEGESYVLNEISKRVKEWKGRWENVWENIILRAKIKETIVKIAEKTRKEELLEAENVVQANEMFRLISEQVREEIGEIESKIIYEKWLEWFKNKAKSL